MATMIFGIITALIPFAIVLCWKFAFITGRMKRFWTSLIIVGCAAFLLLLRISIVKRDLRLVKIPGPENYIYNIPFDFLKLESYYFGGLVAGVVIVYFAFGKKPALKAA